MYIRVCQIYVRLNKYIFTYLHRYFRLAGEWVCGHYFKVHWLALCASSVSQCVAACCSVSQRVAVCCSVLQCVAVCCSVLQCVAACCSVLQRVAACCSVPQYVAVCCSVLQCVAACCSVLQRVAACRSVLCWKTMQDRERLYVQFSGCVAVCCSVLQCGAVYCSVNWHDLYHPDFVTLQRAISHVQKSRITCQKSPITCPLFVRTTDFVTFPLLYLSSICLPSLSNSWQNLCKKPYLMSKEPYYMSKEPSQMSPLFVRTTDFVTFPLLYLSSICLPSLSNSWQNLCKEPYLMSKEPYYMSKEPSHMSPLFVRTTDFVMFPS